jgi:RNA polymerase sigma-70 factor (ECF subfamily)
LGGRSDVGAGDLDDFTQDAMVRVLDRLETFRGDAKFTTWAMAIAIRTSLSALRRRRFATTPLEAVEHDAPASGTADASASGARAELLAALRKAIAEALTPRQRQVLLSELDGVPQVVLADRLSATPGAIYKTAHDARKKLKAALIRAGFDGDAVKEILADGA